MLPLSEEEHEVYEKLTPPRIMPSEGEGVSREYDTGNIPKGLWRAYPFHPEPLKAGRGSGK